MDRSLSQRPIQGYKVTTKQEDNQKEDRLFLANTNKRNYWCSEKEERDYVKRKKATILTNRPPFHTMTNVITINLSNSYLLYPEINPVIFTLNK